MGHIWRAVATALLLAGPATAAEAQAQQQLIKISPKATFKHRHSKLQMPPEVMGLRRIRVIESEGDQLDVAVEYATPDQGEVYTFYIYRAVAGGLPVWFDRARLAIEQRDIYGRATARAGDYAFVPPRQPNASALASVYDLEGSTYRSTGVALVPVGEWLVKLRVSSKTLAAAELDGRVKGALAQLEWPDRITAAPAAAPPMPCAAELALSGKAQPAPKTDNSGAEMLVDALLSGVIMKPGTAKQASAEPPTLWCRDSTNLPTSGVYRANGSTDAYLIALGDAGRGVRVERSAGQQVLEQMGKGGASKPAWTVSLVLLARTHKSAGLDRLPPPAQALEIVEERKFASAAPTWGKGKGKIEIDSGSLR